MCQPHGGSWELRDQQNWVGFVHGAPYMSAYSFIPIHSKDWTDWHKAQQTDNAILRAMVAWLKIYISLACTCASATAETKTLVEIL